MSKSITARVGGYNPFGIEIQGLQGLSQSSIEAFQGSKVTFSYTSY